MMENRIIQNYQYFFGDQVREIEQEQKTLVKSPISQLVKKEELTFGYVDHVDEARGHVVFKFPKNKAPRLKVLRSLTIISKNAWAELGRPTSSWQITFLDFMKNTQYHSPNSEVLPLYYTKRGNPDYDYVGCSSISLSLFDLFKRKCEEGKSLTVLFFMPFPPVNYYNNLSNYMEMFPSPELLIEPKIDYKDWTPEELSFDENHPNAIAETIADTLKNEHCCVVQGPPGVGKSYTIATIVAKYLNEGKTVCATTMANKGLIELIKQDPLEVFVKHRRVSKTNLSADERNAVPGIKPATSSLAIPSGELLCSTNYVLSYAFDKKHIEENGTPTYDLVVIEEASQAFLTSIIAFKSLAKDCLIVGDPMQLPPIIASPQKNIYKSWNVNTQVEGLQTFALGTDVKAYRIVTTFRLPAATAKLTALFYGNRFWSVQKDCVDFSDCSDTFFPKEGGILYYYTKDYTNGVLSNACIDIISNIIGQIEHYYPTRSLAIISPFKESVRQLQKRFLTDTAIEDLTVETIDRIQGMTVDYAILYLPGRHLGFALEERRFNVATSRSRTTTLIITDVPLTNLPVVSPHVLAFLNNSNHIGESSLVMSQSDMSIMEDILGKNDIKALYPGMEAIIDELLDNNIPFSHEGDVDLLDKDGIVIATAGMLLNDYKIAIDPVDDDSKQIFERAGYRVISSNEFSIDLLKQ
ncbi:ATP-binding protein [Xylanibacter ruminicola]|nr:ATP-binding protein [Xylanibacter ruminicola]